MTPESASLCVPAVAMSLISVSVQSDHGEPHIERLPVLALIARSTPEGIHYDALVNDDSYGLIEARLLDDAANAACELIGVTPRNGQNRTLSRRRN
jgi:hypothetical protein